MSNQKKSQEEMLATMRSRLSNAMGAYSSSRENELEDLKFFAGDPDNQYQWPEDVLSTRGSVQGQTLSARPCLTINKLPQHVRQVTNEQRQNRPAGKVIPVDAEGDDQVAEIFDGIVKHIEYMSDADVAYDTACDNQVVYGEGYVRLLTEYCDSNSFDQDLRIGRVRNSFSVYMDPMIQDPCGADANWCFITSDITKEEYERSWPDATPVSTIMAQGTGDASLTSWITEDTVRIAEYFYYTHEKKKLNLYPGDVSAFEGSPEDEEMKLMGLPASRVRMADVKKVMWVKTNGYEVLEESEWVGKWIPVVRVVGNEFEVDGNIFVSGLVRNAKDAQRMYNYWVSQEAEMLALAPKAPFIGYGGQFEGFEHQWKTANINNWPYLEVNADVTDGAGQSLPLPQRAAPPLAQTGLIQAKMGASEDIKSATGQYDASLGMMSNERSGKAILAREKQGDTGTYHYIDNLSRAVRHITRQLVDAIPKIYDTERVARIIGVDGVVKMAKINPMQPEPVKEIVDERGIVLERIYNPSVGKYDVVVTTGPNYMTKRQEALDAMSLLLQSNPQLWQVAGDLFIKNMDWPGAQQMAKRFAKSIDPKLLQEDEKSPELQQAELQMQAMGQELDKLHQMLQSVGKSIEVQDQKRKDYEAEIKAYAAETQRISAVQAGMSPEQIQDIVLGTVHGMMQSGDIRPEQAPQQPPPMEQLALPMEQQAPPMEQQAPPMEQLALPMEQQAPPMEQQIPPIG